MVFNAKRAFLRNQSKFNSYNIDWQSTTIMTRLGTTGRKENKKSPSCPIRSPPKSSRCPRRTRQLLGAAGPAWRNPMAGFPWVPCGWLVGSVFLLGPHLWGGFKEIRRTTILEAKKKQPTNLWLPGEGVGFIPHIDQRGSIGYLRYTSSPELKSGVATCLH